MPFAPEYISLVLAENFDDAKVGLLKPLLAVHRAHLVMLTHCNIVAREDARRLRDALVGLDPAAIQKTAYDGKVEDLFFHVERLLTEAVGPDIAGRLHTARSRNDIDMTMYRMRVRVAMLDLAEATADLRGALIDQADAHRRTVFAAHTHTQPAQVTTVGHYLVAVVEQLERDFGRMAAAFGATNRCPLGACALSGTGFRIDRTEASRLLGFASPTGNTYGSIAAVDYLLESTGAAAVSVTGLGRFVQDLLLWATSEVGYLRLSDGFVQTSSIMPQKRNPVGLEHARSLLSRALAELQGVAAVAHNTPFGDIVDTEDDLQPLVWSAFRNATRAVALTAAVMREATFNADRMRSHLASTWVTITELADSLARDFDLPFGQAHRIAARLARAEKPGASADEKARTLARIAEQEGAKISLTAEDLARRLDPDHFVAVRETPGGPSPAVLTEAIAHARRQLASDAAWLSETRILLESAADGLDRALVAI